MTSQKNAVKETNFMLILASGTSDQAANISSDDIFLWDCNESGYIVITVYCTLLFPIPLGC